MAQSSRPQPGNITTNPTYVDSGPYSGNQWASLFRVLFTGDQEASQGPLKGVWGELSTTHPVANLNLQIDRGAGICNGHWYQNTTAVTIAVTASGGSRSDTLVLLENNTNAALTAGPGNAYDTVGNANIPPYSTRLAVVKGVAITQNLARWMVPLYTFTTGPANITNLTDARTFCEFATRGVEDRVRTFFVPATVGYDGAQVVLQYNTQGPGIPMNGGAQTLASGFFTIPMDYVSDMTATVLYSNPGAQAGSIQGTNTANVRTSGELYNTHVSTTVSTEAVCGGADRTCADWTLPIDDIDTSDYVGMVFYRDGIHAGDTSTDTITVHGWLVSYTADS